jgi:putative transposase
MYVNRFDIICFEDLDVIGLKEKGHNNGMHRSIHDASWSKFIFMLSHKVQSAGRKLIKIDPRNTTQRCSACESIVKKDLSVRVHECPYGKYSCDRDYNASRNILFAEMEQPAAPIESKPLHNISVMPGFGDEVGSRALQDAVVHSVPEKLPYPETYIF